MDINGNTKNKMTLTQIAKEVSIALMVDTSDMISDSRKDDYVRARHIWRTIARIEFGFTPTDIAKYEIAFKGEEKTNTSSKSRSAIYRSVSLVMINGEFEKEYNAVLRHVREIFPDGTDDRVKEIEGITRVTNEEFSERFYHYDGKINPMSGNNWFPSWHFLYHIASPTNSFLIDYYKNKGWFSDFEFHRAEVMGSYVHNRIEDMGKYDIDTTHEQIYRSFPNAKEARRVEECLNAWLNFVKAEEPQVLSYEQMVIADDWGGTVDLRARIKSDNYENVWTIDFKTSKTVYESHKSQVESYRRQFNDDKAAVLVLGNSTKKRYTLTEIKEKDRDFVYNDFLLIKEVAYHRLKQANRLEPHTPDMPEVFTLKGLNITKL